MTSPATILARLSFAALALGATAAQAAGWDATADFTPLTTTNPNGVWSYGYDPAAVPGFQFQAFDVFVVNPSVGAIAWESTTYNPAPVFAKNVGTGSIQGAMPGQIFMHPGPVGNLDAAILRFTAPTAGVYTIDAQFFVGGAGETVASILLNGVSMAALGATSFNPVYTSAGVSLAAGATLDFLVGNAGDYNSDTTPLDVRISLLPVPEPSTWALMALGLVGLGAVARRWR